MDYKKSNQNGTIIIIAGSWILISSLIYTYGYSLLNFTYPDQQPWGSDYWFGLLANISIGLLGGIIGGYLTIRSRYTRNTSFGRAILSVAISFILIFILIYFIGSIMAMFIGDLFGAGEFSVDMEFIQNQLRNTLSPIMLITFFIWALIMAGTVFLMEVNDKFGQGVLWNFIRGKYFHPREEERIFMFLDLKSSTNIAEKIGHHQYFLLLKEFFADITDPILSQEGQIHQYIGDEIIITWNLEKGTPDSKCLNCFFEVKKAVESKAPEYNKKYGIIPEFKAGLHYGKVTVGEIGIVKKDITYSGDVMNTTSRIQNECNKYDTEFLVSSDLLRILPLENFQIERLGDVKLRGKDQKVEINSIDLK